jgi:hypothetical protein
MSIGNPGKSLSTHVVWHEVLRLLDIDVQVLVLPTTVTCPHCKRNNFHVYKDNTSGGAWHYCSACNFAGDSIELAAAVWRQDIATTILRLNAQGVSFPANALDPSIINKYVLGHVEYRKGINALWAEAQARLPRKDTETLVKLQDKFTEGHSASHTTWPRRGKEFLGGHHRDDIVRALHPASAKTHGPNAPAHQLDVGTHRTFKGNGWSDVLMMPHYDLPGKIRGFTFIGRDGGPDDIVYRRIGVTGSRPKRGADVPHYDPGLTMYNTMFTYHPEYKNTTFVLDDPVRALRLQMKHLRQSNTPLPICGSYSDGKIINRKIWDTVFPRNFIFWGRTLTADLIQQARRANGRIAVSKMLARLVSHPAERTPIQWLARMERTAKPWQQVLEAEIADASLPVAESLLLRLQLSAEDLKDFATHCSLAVREKLEELFDAAGYAFKTVTIDGFTITESEEGWVRDNGTVVSDTILRIEQIVQHPVNNCAYYKGYIERKGQRIEFTDKAELIETHAAKWLRGKLIPAGLGRPNIPGRWVHSIITIAQLFHEPENVIGVDSLGWVPEQQAFVLPHFAIRRDGEIISEAIARVVTDNAPGVALRKPQTINAKQVEQLTGVADYMDVFWATTACVAANIIAPALNQPTTGIALLGTGAETMGRATARVHGCVDLTLGNLTLGLAVERLHKATQAHNWPFVIKKYERGDRRIAKAWLSDYEAKNCVIPVTWFQAQAIMLNGGWTVIEGHHPETSFSSALSPGQYVMPAFLQHLCRKRLDIPREQGIVRGVLFELAYWFKGMGGRDIRSAGKLIHVADNPIQEVRAGDYFLNIVFQLIDDAKLTTVRAGFNDEGKGSQIVQHNDVMYIPQKTTLEFSAKRGTPGLDVNVLAQEFDSHRIDDMLYWAISVVEWRKAVQERGAGKVTKII